MAGRQNTWTKIIHRESPVASSIASRLRTTNPNREASIASWSTVTRYASTLRLLARLRLIFFQVEETEIGRCIWRPPVGLDNLGRTRPTGVSFGKCPIVESSIRRRRRSFPEGWRFPSDLAQTSGHADSWRTATDKALRGAGLQRHVGLMTQRRRAFGPRLPSLVEILRSIGLADRPFSRYCYRGPDI